VDAGTRVSITFTFLADITMKSRKGENKGWKERMPDVFPESISGFFTSGVLSGGPAPGFLIPEKDPSELVLRNHALGPSDAGDLFPASNASVDDIPAEKILEKGGPAENEVSEEGPPLGRIAAEGDALLAWIPASSISVSFRQICELSRQMGTRRNPVETLFPSALVSGQAGSGGM
jgi:hypothetical protein